MPQINQPTLRKPGEQPQGPVVVDWSNGLTKGLIFAKIGDTKVNLVNGDVPIETNITRGTGAGGRWTSATDNDASEDNFEYKALPFYDVTDAAGVTMVTITRFVAGGLFTGLVAKGSAASPRALNYLFGTRGDGSEFYFGHAPTGSFIDVFSGLNIPSSKAAFVAARVGGGDIKFWVDGSTVTTTYPGTLTANTSPLTLHATTNMEVEQNSFSEQYLTLLWNRQLSDAEIEALRQDAYQVLRPVVDLPLFVGAAGGGSTTITGTGAITLGAVEVAGAAERALTGTGAITLAPTEVAGTAERKIPGSGALTLGPITVSGAAEREITGTGAITGAPIEVAGIAERELTASGALVLGPVEVSGTAERSLLGSGAITLGAVEVDGSGTLGGEVTGTGNIGISPVEVAGVAERSILGTGAIDLSPVTVAGTAERTITGTGDITLPSAVIAGIGSVGSLIAGSGAITLAAILVAGTALRSHTGTGDITVAPVEVFGAGSISGAITGSGNLIVPATTVSGVAERVITGSGDITFAAVLVSGTQAALGARRNTYLTESKNIVTITASMNMLQIVPDDPNKTASD